MMDSYQTNNKLMDDSGCSMMTYAFFWYSF